MAIKNTAIAAGTAFGIGVVDGVELVRIVKQEASVGEASIVGVGSVATLLYSGSEAKQSETLSDECALDRPPLPVTTERRPNALWAVAYGLGVIIGAVNYKG